MRSAVTCMLLLGGFVTFIRRSVHARRVSKYLWIEKTLRPRIPASNSFCYCTTLDILRRSIRKAKIIMRSSEHSKPASAGNCSRTLANCSNLKLGLGLQVRRVEAPPRLTQQDYRRSVLQCPQTGANVVKGPIKLANKAALRMRMVDTNSNLNS